MKNIEVINLWRTLNEVNFGDVSPRFTLKKAKIKKKLDEFIEPFKAVDEEIEKIRQEALALVEKDENGNPIIENGNYKVVEENSKKFDELIKKFSEKSKARDELLQEDADIELEKLPLSEFPEKMNDKQTEALLPIIEE